MTDRKTVSHRKLIDPTPLIIVRQPSFVEHYYTAKFVYFQSQKHMKPIEISYPAENQHKPKQSRNFFFFPEILSPLFKIFPAYRGKIKRTYYPILPFLLALANLLSKK